MAVLRHVCSCLKLRALGREGLATSAGFDSEERCQCLDIDELLPPDNARMTHQAALKSLRIAHIGHSAITIVQVEVVGPAGGLERVEHRILIG